MLGNITKNWGKNIVGGPPLCFTLTFWCVIVYFAVFFGFIVCHFLIKLIFNVNKNLWFLSNFGQFHHTSLGICTKNLLHEGWCTHFSIQNIEHARNNIMKHDVALNKWSNIIMFLMFWLLYVSKHNYAESTMVARRVSFFARIKKNLQEEKTFPTKIQRLMHPNEARS